VSSTEAQRQRWAFFRMPLGHAYRTGAGGVHERRIAERRGGAARALRRCSAELGRRERMLSAPYVLSDGAGNKRHALARGRFTS
jgi:hypothetical protein